MKRKWGMILALVLVLALTLCGCRGFWTLGMPTAFPDMEYVRPDMDAYRQALEDTRKKVGEEKNVEQLMESVYGLYELYYDFSTNYNLAQIHYFLDMTDTYWEKEYSWCMEKSAEVSAGMDQLLYALADCDLREELEDEAYFGEGFFDNYDGESLWDETFTELMEQESALVDRYYDLSAQSAEVEYYSQEYFEGVGLQIEEVFLEMILLRQQIAAYAGYDSYPEFAYEFYYYRDYTPEQAQKYMDEISRELVPLYTDLDSDVWDPAYEACSEKQVFNYVKSFAQSAGGVAADAFELMEDFELYDLTYSENKYDASFEVYLVSYYVPFVFVNPQGSQADQLTFVHEFGHFCNDYAVGGTGVGIDVAEVFSQGAEYLSLCYGKDTGDLTRMKLADSLCVFVEQSAYASFENQVYLLEEPTLEDVRALYGKVNGDFGMDGMGRDNRDYTLIPHFFMSPMYVISYVVSNDGAMQIYEKELEKKGAGLKLWEDSLYTMEAGYLAFVEDTGLENPFTEGRAAQLRKVFAEKLG